MDWYTVTKTINGRRHLYRQRSYWVGGKVKTESQHRGSADAVAMSGPVSVTGLDEIDAGIVAVVDRTTLELDQSEKPSIPYIH
jgi:hypothetical protein